MRAITKFPQEEEARRFSFFLKKEGIANSIETDGKEFALWIENEDDIPRAQTFLEELEKGTLHLPEVVVEEKKEENENESEEEVVEKEEEFLESEELEEEEKVPKEPVVEKRSLKRYFLTGFFFLLCALIFLVNDIQERRLPKTEFMAPIQKELLYDLPSGLKEIQQIIEKIPPSVLSSPSKQSPEVQEALKEINAVPMWRGLEPFLITKWQDPKEIYIFKGTLFGKIREGEIWRLVSPAFLHVYFIHLMFNVFWLWVLGKQMEERLSKMRYLFFILIVAIFTNTAQYLMSGYYFMGYSGVIMGLAGFIWMRQRVAPWEGYFLSNSVALFIFFYILALLVFEFFSFGLQMLGIAMLSPVIANTAHVVGALCGLFMGRLSFFARRESER